MTPWTDQQKIDYVARRRALKALSIADTLSRAHCDVATARTLDTAARRLTEQAAMVKPASEQTWTIVFAILARRQSSSREEAEAHERSLLGT